MNAVLDAPAGLAVVHSSLAALAPGRGFSRWDMLFAIKSLVREGWTLAFPAFTFSFCRDGYFDPDKTASETGILADWVQADMLGALRTDHPIYSFVVVGPRVAEFASFPSATTFGDTSPFGFLDAQDAHVVMLGADWRFATPFHRYEELAEVPYRLFKDFDGRVARRGQKTPVTARMYVRDLEIAAENDFEPLVSRLREAGRIVSKPLWRGTIEGTTMRAIRESAESLLEADPLAFVSNKAEVRHRLDIRAEAGRHDPFRVAVLGMSNLDLAAADLESSLAALVPERRWSIFVPPFGQLTQQILDQGSELAEFDPEFTIFADRLEDLVGVASLDLADPALVVEASRQHAGLIRNFAEANGGTMLVHRFALLGRNSVEKAVSLSAMVAECNRTLDETLGDLDRVVWLDVAAEAAQAEAVLDARLWHIGRLPFAESFARQLVRRWSGVALALLGKTARLLVLDLDNTLWGGVLGEDGAKGIAIGGDFPGNAFQRFQQTLKGLADRGVALAVCSKNDEDLALDALSTHTSMVLRPDDLVSHRINWQPKWQNIREIAAELDLGLGSIMFIDDNPVEREAVKRNLPMVKVLALPQEPTAYADALLDSPFMESIRSGHEDRKRVVSYRTRKKIALERQSAASLQDFLHGLEMQLYIQRLDDGNIARAAQLCQKTNQFNTTTRRYGARDLERLSAAGADVAVIGLQDKFSEAENIGLIILKPDETSPGVGEVDLFLLSCRVLGRTVEHAVMSWALARADRRGWQILRGEIVETPRNSPARGIFADNGFDPGAVEGLWQKSASGEEPPHWFKLYDDFL